MRFDAAHAVERAGIARGIAAVATADLVLRVWPVDASPILPAGIGELTVVTKIDLSPAGTSLPAGALATSAVTGDGIDRLAAEIAARLVPEEHAQPDLLAGAVPFTQRHLDAVARLTCRPASPPSSGRG